jgi:hypothetical protein
MKFLVIALPGTNPLPREQAAELLTVGISWIKSKIEDGTVECHYSLFGGGGMGIVNAASHEAMLETLLAYPLYPFFTWEVKPLLDYEAAYKQYASFYQQIGS